MRRVSERAEFDVPTRLRLVEGDLDKNDAAVDKLAARIDRMNRTMVGMLISVSTACVLLAVNAAILLAGA